MPDDPQTPEQDPRPTREDALTPDARPQAPGEQHEPGSDEAAQSYDESARPSDEAREVPDEPAELPDEDELERVAVPARVRRAPKFGAFIVAGAVVGAVVALLATALVGWLSDDAGASDVASGQGFISFLDGQGAIRAVMGLTGAVVGGFVGGALASRADRRSRDPLA